MFGESLENRGVLNGAHISVSNALANVGGVGGYELDFVASLAARSDKIVTVNYSTVGAGTAVAGVEYGDYQNTAGTLTFTPGQTASTRRRLHV